MQNSPGVSRAPGLKVRAFKMGRAHGTTGNTMLWLLGRVESAIGTADIVTMSFSPWYVRQTDHINKCHGPAYRRQARPI